MPAPAPPSLARLVALASLLHFGFDSLLRVWPATTPPWLLTPYMGEGFREMLELLGRTPISAVTSCVQGAVSAIFALALQEVATRRWAALAALLCGAWLLSGALMFWVYLDAPALTVFTSLAAGVPRAAAMAYFMDRGMARAALAGPAGDPAGPEAP